MILFTYQNKSQFSKIDSYAVNIIQHNFYYVQSSQLIVVLLYNPLHFI